MKWNRNKPTAEKTRVELELTEVFDYIHDIKGELAAISAQVDNLKFMVQISHSLLVVRKVIKELDEVLD